MLRNEPSRKKRKARGGPINRDGNNGSNSPHIDWKNHPYLELAKVVAYHWMITHLGGNDHVILQGEGYAEHGITKERVFREVTFVLPDFERTAFEVWPTGDVPRLEKNLMNRLQLMYLKFNKGKDGRYRQRGEEHPDNSWRTGRWLPLASRIQIKHPGFTFKHLFAYLKEQGVDWVPGDNWRRVTWRNGA